MVSKLSQIVSECFKMSFKVQKIASNALKMSQILLKEYSKTYREVESLLRYAPDF